MSSTLFSPSVRSTTTFERAFHTATAPTDTVYVVFGIRIDNTAESGINYLFDDLYARRMTDTGQLVQGAVTNENYVFLPYSTTLGAGEGELIGGAFLINVTEVSNPGSSAVEIEMFYNDCYCFGTQFGTLRIYHEQQIMPSDSDWDFWHNTLHVVSAVRVFGLASVGHTTWGSDRFSFPIEAAGLQSFYLWAAVPSSGMYIEVLSGLVRVVQR